MNFSFFYHLVNGEVEEMSYWLSGESWRFGSRFFDTPIRVDLKDKSTLGKTGISDKCAIYIFRSKEEFIISSISNFKDGINISPMRMYDSNTYKLSKQEVYYIGECDNLSSRASAHLSSSNNEKDPYGLHLGNLNRKALRDISEVVIFPFKDGIFPSKSAIEQKECREAIELRIRGNYLPCIGK
jgi:hypothetical protein